MDSLIKNSSITFLGTIINGILGALFYILTFRLLGPSDFGLLFIAITTLTLMSDIADLGSDTGVVRFVANNFEKNFEKAMRFLKLALEIRLIVSITVIIAGWFLSPLIADNFFRKEELRAPLQLAFLGVGSAQLFAFSLSAFQSVEKFTRWSGIQVSTNSLRLICLLVIFFVGSLNINSSMIIYIVTPLLGFLASLFFLPRQLLTVKNEWIEGREFFHYSKWIALTVILAAISSRLDTMISGRLLTAIEIGYYGAATQLVLIIPQIMRAIETVIAPKMASFKDKGELLSYFKKTQFYITILATLGLISIPIIFMLIPLIYGQVDIYMIWQIFVILLIANLLFLMTVPINAAIVYYYSYPKLYTYISLINLIVVLICGWFLISNYRVIGAALTVLLSMIINLSLPSIWLIFKFKESKA